MPSWEKATAVTDTSPCDRSLAAPAAGISRAAPVTRLVSKTIAVAASETATAVTRAWGPGSGSVRPSRHVTAPCAPPRTTEPSDRTAPERTRPSLEPDVSMVTGWRSVGEVQIIAVPALPTFIVASRREPSGGKSTDVTWAPSAW